VERSGEAFDKLGQLRERQHIPAQVLFDQLQETTVLRTKQGENRGGRLQVSRSDRDTEGEGHVDQIVRVSTIAELSIPLTAQLVDIFL